MIKVRVSLPDGTESSIDSERRNLIPHINEREDQQGAEIFPFNLVKLRRQTRQERFYHRNDLPSNLPSLNPDCFDGGPSLSCNTSNSRRKPKGRKLKPRPQQRLCAHERLLAGPISLGKGQATFKAVWGQRQINVDRVSILVPRSSGRSSRHLTGRSQGEVFQGVISYAPSPSPCRGHQNADSYSRCFINESKQGIAAEGKSWVTPDPRLSIESFLDRILKDNQGGCLYEWPDSQSYRHVVSGIHRQTRKVWIVLTMILDKLVNNSQVRILPCRPFWQKPAIGPTAVRISAVPIRGREEGEPIPMKHVGSIRTLPAEGKGWNYGKSALIGER